MKRCEYDRIMEISKSSRVGCPVRLYCECLDILGLKVIPFV